MRVTEILIYPIKGARAVAVEQAVVRPRGLAGDRRWMLVDAEGRFLQQRVQPRLACVAAHPSADGSLQVAAEGSPPLHVPLPAGEQRRSVTIWRDQVDAADAGDEAAAWFTAWLGTPCRLVCMDARARRPVSPDYGLADAEVSFADTMPLLLATRASLADLNRRLRQPVAMARFRPNVVVDGGRPWEEDSWRRIRIGSLPFLATHPCARCVVTTVDQQTGEKSPDGEPLRTLSRFRRGPDGVLFGLNLAPRESGTIRVGDPLVVEPAGGERP